MKILIDGRSCGVEMERERMVYIVVELLVKKLWKIT